MKLVWENSVRICQSNPATACKTEIHNRDWFPMKAFNVLRSHIANTLNMAYRSTGIKENMNDDHDVVLKESVFRFTKATSLTFHYTNQMIQIVEELERTRARIADLLWDKGSDVEIGQEMVKLKDVVNKHLDNLVVDLASKEDRVRKHFTSVEILVKVVDGVHWMIVNIASTVDSIIKSLGLYMFHLMKGILDIMDYTRRVVSHESYRRMEEELDEARAEIARLRKDKADVIEKASQLEVYNNTLVNKNAEVDREVEKPQISLPSKEADIQNDHESLSQRRAELNDFRDKAVATAKNFQKEINRLKQEMVLWLNTYSVDN